MENEDTLRRIRKLLSLASSSNEHEAAVAVAKAQEIAFQHDLDLSTVEGNLEVDSQIAEDAIAAFGGRVANWKQALFYAVSKTSLCEPYMYGSRAAGRHRAMLIGRKSDIEIARYTFDYLITELERLSKEFMATQIYYDRVHAGQLRRSWLEGAVASVRSKLWSEYRARTSQSEQSTALVVSREGEIKSYLEKKGIEFEKRQRTQSSLDPYAYRQGREAGANLGIRPGLSGVGNRQIR